MRKNSLKQFVALAIALCMTLGIMPTNAFAAATDTAGHWAKSYLEKLVTQGVMSGYEDGTMKPNAIITKAELITMINKVFGFVEEENINPPIKKWYTPEFQKAVKAGYIAVSDANTMQEAPINRQQAALYIYKAFGLPAGQPALLNFTDNDKISAWAQVAVASLVENGLISGFDDGSFKPQGDLTRAQAAIIISKFAGDIYSNAGEYNKNGSIKTIGGNVVINTPNVELANMRIRGNLYIAPGVADGDVTLTNVSVTGNTYVLGGGENSIKIVDSTLGNMTVNKKNNKPVSIKLFGKSDIKEAGIKSFAILFTDGLNKNAEGFRNVYVPKDANKQTELKLNGNFKQIEVIGDAIIDLLKGKIEDLNVRKDVIVIIKTATGTIVVKVRTESDVNVNGKKVASGSEAKVSENGTVSNIVVAAATPTPTPVPTTAPYYPPSVETDNGSKFVAVENIEFELDTKDNKFDFASGSAVKMTVLEAKAKVVPSNATRKEKDIVWTYVLPEAMKDNQVTFNKEIIKPDSQATLLRPAEILLIATIPSAGLQGRDYRKAFSIDEKGNVTTDAVEAFSVSNLKVTDATHFTFTIPKTQAGGLVIKVTGNGYDGAVSDKDVNGVYTCTLTKGLTSGLAYTLTISKTGYLSYSNSLRWVDPTLKVPVTAINVTGAGKATTITSNGETLQMSAEVLPEDATNKTVTWTVENVTGKATINASGLLKAVTNGTVKVIATSVDDSKIKGELTVTLSGQIAVVESIVVKTQPTKNKYVAGETLNLAGLVVTLNKNDDNAEDVTVADFAAKGITVDPKDGYVLSTPGEVTITVTHTASTKTATLKVTVDPAPTYYITITPNVADPAATSDVRLYLGGTEITNQKCTLVFKSGTTYKYLSRIADDMVTFVDVAGISSTVLKTYECYLIPISFNGGGIVNKLNVEEAIGSAGVIRITDIR